jgi:hypothetical protein
MIDIKKIISTQLPGENIIIKTRIDEITQFKCFIATDTITNIHYFNFEISKEVPMPDLKKFKFQGVSIQIFDLNSVLNLNVYLMDNDLLEIFILLIQNIAEVLVNCQTENEALQNTLNVILKWKKLFDKIKSTALTIEEQKGLIGELLTFSALLEENYLSDKLVESWTGPTYEDKDYVFEDKGLEIKFTTEKTPHIQISSERQLDIQNLTTLHLILYISENVKSNGFSLNSIIEEIRQNISQSQNSLNLFNAKILKLGYLEEDFENYEQLYAIKKRNIYHVTSSFPKITSSILPIGIFNTQYSIELSAADRFIIEPNTISELIN